MPITDAQLRNAKPKGKPYQIHDRDALYLDIRPSGRKYWRVRATKDGKRTWITLGEYPALTITEARERTGRIRQNIRDSLPPTQGCERRVTFGEVAAQWHKEHTRQLNGERDPARLWGRLENHILPYIGQYGLDVLTPRDILSVLRRLADEGKFETMKRVRAMIGQIYRYAQANDLTMRDPTRALAGSIPVPKGGHFASVTNPEEVGALMRSIAAYNQPVVRALLLFSAYTFCRPGEVRRAEWTEINEPEAIWKIPAAKMKKRRVHMVPLSEQALGALAIARAHGRKSRYCFPNSRTGRCLGDVAATAALRALGYGGDRMTAHGFRSMASTLLNENGFNPDWIERQLAHAEENSVRAAYNYAEHLSERRTMMQWYADYLDALRDGLDTPPKK